MNSKMELCTLFYLKPKRSSIKCSKSEEPNNQQRQDNKSLDAREQGFQFESLSASN